VNKTDQNREFDNLFSISEKKLFDQLGSSPQGLRKIEITGRKNRYGKNVITDRVRVKGFILFLNQFKSPLVLILVAAAILSIFLDQWLDALIILAVVSGSALIGYRQEFNAQEAIEKLKESIAHRSIVRRDGKESEIPSSDIVPGDIVLLKAGSMIPADGRIIKARDLHVNESAMTGESFPVEKVPGTIQPDVPVTQMNNAVFMGTSVRSGTAEIVIAATGSNTRFGHIAHKLTFKRPETTFEQGVKHFGFLLTRITFVLVILVFMINVFVDRTTIESLLFAVALAVGMAPELLPAIISVTLSQGARRMSEKGVIVRHLNAIENLGAMDVLCTDKTGTLTEDKIRLEKAVNSKGKEHYGVLMMACINARFETGMENPLDAALMEMAETADLEFANIQKIDEIPYDFIRKRLTIAIDDGTGIQLITKGAFRQILEICTMVDTGEEIKELTTIQKEHLRRKFKSWGNKGFRVLGVADRNIYRDQEDCPARFTRDNEHSFTFRGFLLFSDAPKIDIQLTLRNLRRLGSEIKILTGDNRYVTRHLAAYLGLDHKTILTGEELSKMRDEALFQRVNETVVFAELDPNQKERVIRALRRNDKVVGYLGDGINDVNAMREADISLSVDSAVDVAKAAADMVLLEKDLSVLNQGIEEGRKTFANTMKYILTTSSANFGNMISMAMASAFLGFLPLLPKQILLNNFLSDLPLLAITTDHVDTESMQHPQKWDVRYIRNFMILFGLISTLFDLLTFAILIFIFQADPDLFRTGWFFVSLLTEIGIIFVIRTRKSVFSGRPSRGLVSTSIVTIAATIILIYLPIYNITGFIPLGGILFFSMVLISLVYLWATEWLKKRFYRVLEG
jgi:P-type Mg2+ transporter